METTPDVSREGAPVADRLSDLPDCILEDILSRVTSRQAARTSALSRRWSHLSGAVARTCVDIDQREPSETRAPAEFDATDVHASLDDLYRRIKERRAFQNFADKLTLPSSPPLDTFRLRVSGVDFVAAHRWIWRALERRPAAFHLSCYYNDDPLADDRRKPAIPDVILHRHAGAYTRRLRTLFLSGLSLSRDFMDAVTADSPVLEDVHLRHCSYGFSRIASRSLKKLSMNDCRSLYREEYGKLALTVPRMVSLHINGHPPPVISASEMRSLVSASLAHRAGDLGVLCSLRHARRLDLSGFSMAALLVKDPEPEDTLVFVNLRTLVLKSCELGAECQVVRRFLRNSPRLETLTLRDCTLLSRGARSNGRKIKTSSKPAGHLVDEVAKVLGDISKEAAVCYQIVGCSQDGRAVEISST